MQILLNSRLNSHRLKLRNKNSILYLFSILSILFSGLISLTNGDSGWLRVCDSDSNSKQYEIETDKCPHGAWLSKKLSSGCVCLNGLWAIGQSWCDEDYRLLLGKGHCFKVHGNIQRLAYLGDPDEPFTPSNFMTKKNGHIFKQFEDKISTPYEYELNFHSQNMNKTILRLQPNSAKSFLMERTPRIIDSDFDDSTPPICLQSNDPLSRSSEEDSETTLFVYKIKEAIKNLQITDKCPAGVDTYSQERYDKMSVLKVRPGESLHVKSGTILKSSVSCAKSCKLQPSIIRHKRSVKRGRGFKKQKGKTIDNRGLVSASINSTDPPGFSDVDKQRLINEETVRIVKAEVMYLLERKRPPRQNNSNWKLLQKAKEVFTTVCPKIETPKFLINAMVRIFRVLFMHSRDFNPYPHVYEEGDQNQRIINSLQACMDESEPIQFEYLSQKYNDSVCIERNYPITNKSESFCGCYDTLDKVNLNYTKNTSNPHQKFNLSREEFALPTNYSFVLMPPSERFNGSNRDLPIETAWKIITFSHYYCAKYFQQNPTDHSAFLVKLETFFNSEIIYRWSHPGLRTNETWQNVYTTHDLQKFTESIDACVAAAKYVSEYPEWIIRPTWGAIQRKKRSLDYEEVQSGRAYCLQEPNDPVEKLGVEVTNECYEWNNL